MLFATASARALLPMANVDALHGFSARLNLQV